jgi:hypothetical protein
MEISRQVSGQSNDALLVSKNEIRIHVLGLPLNLENWAYQW